MAKKETVPNAAAKEVAFYQEMVAGWVTTQIEADKQAMGLSGLAIGLLVSLRSTIDSVCTFVIWCVAGMCFFASIGLGLRVLYLNARYIDEIISERSAAKEQGLSARITAFTMCIYLLFATGAFFAVILAILTSELIIKILA